MNSKTMAVSAKTSRSKEVVVADKQDALSKNRLRRTTIAETAQIIVNSAIYTHGNGPDVGSTVKDVFDACVSQSKSLSLNGQWTVTVVMAEGQCATQRNTTYEGEFQYSPNGKYAIVATFTELPDALADELSDDPDIDDE